MKWHALAIALGIAICPGGKVIVPAEAADPVPAELRSWLETPQHWERNTDGPILSLGPAGGFDDTHIFAPAVAFEDGVFSLWYCGSRGSVDERVFQIGLATSPDGKTFTRYPASPVFRFNEAKRCDPC